jgi:hypothetical protein
MISQCHISKSVQDFPFRRLYKLGEYVDSLAPCIFFGCYNDEDFQAILNHRSLAVVVWCGQDSLDFRSWGSFGANVRHASGKNVCKYVRSKGVTIKEILCANLAEPAEVTPLGDKVYAYAPKSCPKYHGIEVINQLREKIPFDIIIGDGSIPQDEWRSGKCNEYYNQCFVGLALSKYAGGTTSVIELGVRGRKCVTNVATLGNVIRWENIDDVVSAIWEESHWIGYARFNVAQATYASMDLTNKFLNENEYA